MSAEEQDDGNDFLSQVQAELIRRGHDAPAWPSDRDDAGPVWSAAEMIGGLLERLRTVEEEAEKWREMDTCMCGTPIKDHGLGDGHAPVSMHDYRLHSAEEDRDQLRAELEQCNERLRKAEERLEYEKKQYALLSSMGAAADKNLRAELEQCKQQISTARGLLDDSFNGLYAVWLYDEQGVNQAHRVLAGGFSPRQTKTEGGI